MWGAGEFGPDFQRVLIRACVDDSQLIALVKRFTTSKQLAFTDPASSWAWQVIGDMEYPTMLVLETEARRISPTDPARIGVDAILAAKDWRDFDYVRQQIVEWARRQVFKMGFEESREKWNTQDFEGAMSIMMRRIDEVNEIRVADTDRGWFFEEFDLRQSRRAYVAAEVDVFPTGIDQIDQAMHGGLSVSELAVVMAYAKIGKSFFLNTQGVLAARTRRNVLHFPLEGGRKKTEDRYEAAFASTIYSDVRKGKIASAVAFRMRREYAILKEFLVVRGYANAHQLWHVGIDEILGELSELRRSKGWVPELIIVDYGDLMTAPGDNEQQRQKAAFRQLMALANRCEFPGHRGYAVWTGTQAQRPDKSADDREHLLKGRDAADCYEKIRVADGILTINRTNLEQEHNQARVCLSDYRDARDGATVRITTNYDHGMFCIPGEEHEPAAPIAPEAGSGT